MNMPFKLISPNWNDTPNVNCFTVISERDASEINFKGDSAVTLNSLDQLEKILGTDVKIHWVDQAHKNTVTIFPESIQSDDDAAITSSANYACAMKSADCVPIFFSSLSGDEVAITHAGWKGLQLGVVSSTIKSMRTPASQLKVWIGPAISRMFYEVDDQVVNKFKNSDNADEIFTPKENGKYYMDLYKFTFLELASSGINNTNISGGDFCTYSDLRIHSVRRDGKNAGRNASVIWIS